MTERTEPLSPEPYKGVHDYYPEQWGRIQRVMTLIRGELCAHGFEEYQASPLERAELYEAKTSEEIVNQQTYTFEDRGGRRVTLRPEMTPTLARMIARKRHELVFPARWFSIGNRFRYERPQKGRSREFYQADVDIIGFSGNEAETEAVVMAYRVLRALGAENNDFKIRVNSRTLLNTAGEAIGLTPEDTLAYLAILDRKDKMTPEAFEEARAPFRRAGEDPLECILSGSEPKVVAAQQIFEGVVAEARARGVANIVFDPTITRGFLYYTGIVFEAFDTNPENPRAILGGGRYDGLVALFGGAPLPAVGFAIGLETLMDFLTTHNLLPQTTACTDLFIGTPTEDDRPRAEAFADSLRADGARALVNTSSRGLGDQIKEAVRRGIPFFLAYGEHEAESDAPLRLKRLATGEELHVSRKDVPRIITE